jgi:hypothetical protein
MAVMTISSREDMDGWSSKVLKLVVQREMEFGSPSRGRRLVSRKVCRVAVAAFRIRDSRRYKK